VPLRDHFRPPLAEQRHWESFHAAWAAEIMRTLNRNVLPPSCFAEAQVHVGSQVQIDVATFEQEQTLSAGAVGENGGGVAVATWTPPTTELVIPAIFPDEIEIRVMHKSGGPTLVGAIELISPGNKDRRDSRRAFVAKCASYLQQGIGLVIVDIVSERQVNLHNELIRFLEQPPKFELAEEPSLYAVAYRPSRRESGDQIELWPMPLTLGQRLPTMPLALRAVTTVPVDLETTYTTTCADSRL
jgi:hypothetical protein